MVTAGIKFRAYRFGQQTRDKNRRTRKTNVHCLQIGIDPGGGAG